MISFNMLKLGYKLPIDILLFLEANTNLNTEYDMPIYRYFFSYRLYRIISVRNLLPESIVSSSTLAAFKTRVKKFDLHHICHLTY